MMFVIDFDNYSLRWFGGVTFIGALTALAVFLKESILPGIDRQESFTLFYNLVFSIKLILFFCAVFGPYPALMFSIHYSQLFTAWEKRLAIIFAIPPFLIWVFFREYVAVNIKSLSFVTIVLGATIYYILGCSFIIISYVIEKNFRIKKQRMLALLIYIPVYTFVLAINYVFPLFGINEIWNYNILVVLDIFLIIFFAVKYGVMGVRLKIEKYDLNQMVRTMSSGFLNHSLKNEINKIAIIADNINYVETKEELAECVNIIKESTAQMHEMIKRVNQQIEDISLNEGPLILNQVVDSALKAALICAEGKNIEFIKEYSNVFNMKCDAVHIKEVIVNILKNSIEAIENCGKVHIKLYRNKGYIVLEIIDTGCGIQKNNLPRLSEPFFTTKNKIHNTGLGLTYCYKVMQYYGSLEFFSECNKGTTAFLNFSVKKLLRHE